MFYSDAPRTIEEAQKIRYNRWAGNPRGVAFDKSRCAFEVSEHGKSCLFHQCTRNTGSEPGGLYYRIHAKKIK